PAQPQGMIYALERDVVSLDTPIDKSGNDGILPGGPLPLKAGHVRLRSGKRPRPIVLRMNVGDCMEVQFTNLLAPVEPQPVGSLQPETRDAGLHVQGLNLVGSINSDGSWVGANPGASGGMAKPGETVTYKYFAPD